MPISGLMGNAVMQTKLVRIEVCTYENRSRQQTIMTGRFRAND